ncbi:MAG: hypothetical protein JSV85_06835 [Candidatus Bathyarchaeota archaeon]|nr:MAG: hypothetical protein JSV85_06835 [Candidatus Bathyarchaeota archaeon]
MNGKIASLLLICLVATLVVYGSSIALSGYAAKSADAQHPDPTTTTVEPCCNLRLDYSKLKPELMGDDIDGPTPHTYA